MKKFALPCGLITRSSDDEIDELAADNEAAITAKRQVAAQRPDQTVTLENVDETCDTLVPELRLLLEKKFKKDYQRYYKEFGFVTSGKNWILPIDRDTRRDNIRDLLRPALLKYGMARRCQVGRRGGRPHHGPRHGRYHQARLVGPGDSDGRAGRKGDQGAPRHHPSGESPVARRLGKDAPRVRLPAGEQLA